jgi:hypothetical protein
LNCTIVHAFTVAHALSTVVKNALGNPQKQGMALLHKRQINSLQLLWRGAMPCE